jgi:hypothetical protein
MMASEAGAGAGAGCRLWTLIGRASALGLFLLSRPYWGIFHDAELYVGRAMADADPAGLGRDIFFANEGQSAFSIYPHLSGVWLRTVGPAPGALILTLVGLFAWFVALAAFAARLARGRLLWACLVVASVLPSYYGQVFRYGEQFASPRLPAEALVLAALAALATGRRWLALGTLALAAAIHPIMAAPALAVWLLVQAYRDRRWLLLPTALLAAMLAAGAAGLTLAERLFRLMDPAWANALSVNAYLFPSLWPPSAWADLAVRGATVLIALRFIPSRTARAILASIVIVAALGLALTLVAADYWLVVMVVQAQPWRALWLLSLAGALTFPVAAVGLLRLGPGGHVTLACLAVSWLLAPLAIGGALAAAASLALFVAASRRPGLFTTGHQTIAWIIVGIFAALIFGQRAQLLLPIVATRPPDASVLRLAWLFWVLALPVACGAVILAAWKNPPIRHSTAAAGALGLLSLAAACWDDRSQLTRIMDAHRPDPALVELLPPGPGEILWLKNGVGPAWRLTGLPNWASYTQGASIVFSPSLGAIWRDRMDRLVAARLADAVDRDPWRGRASVLEPSRADIESFCQREDAPGAIVVPLEGSIVLPQGLPFATYRLPAPRHETKERAGALAWVTTEEVAILPCRTPRPAAALRPSFSG